MHTMAAAQITAPTTVETLIAMHLGPNLQANAVVVTAARLTV